MFVVCLVFLHSTVLLVVALRNLNHEKLGMCNDAWSVRHSEIIICFVVAKALERLRVEG
jgi:hypothetical protein